MHTPENPNRPGNSGESRRERREADEVEEMMARRRRAPTSILALACFVAAARLPATQTPRQRGPSISGQFITPSIQGADGRIDVCGLPEEQARVAPRVVD